ncbi:MAG TPA: glutathione transferase [Longimicrobium sp.]|nr:glutathione transferase [Longimicrobium sp.]
MPASSADELVIHGDAFWISPYFFTAFIAAKEKGIPFQVKEVALQRKEHREADYLAKSITGRVPALRHGDFWLAESNVMAEYIDEAFSAPGRPRLFPEDVRERARARQLMAWIRSDLMPVREERSTFTMFYERAQKPLSEKGREAAAALIRAAEAVIPEGRTTLFREWSIADADLGFVLHRLLLNGDEVPKRVRAYAEAQWQRPSVREFVDRKRPPYEAY